MTLLPIDRYRGLLRSGTLQPDPHQERAALALDALCRALSAPKARGFLGFGAAWGAKPGTNGIKGLYLHGDVGRGKSLLMDMFFESVPLNRKRRVHFNAFMAQTHALIHEWRNTNAGQDAIAPVAKHIQEQTELLCLDEFQVTDVADAMILGRLFEKLFASGVTLVLTSNTAPNRLYEGGLNRQNFLPFIALILERLTIVELNGPLDYRQGRMAGLNLYISPLGPAADEAMNAAWRQLTEGQEESSGALDVLERKFAIPRMAGGVARFSFDELCAEALGAADYLALARNFHTLMIDRIPHLGAERSNDARRFTLLIDTLYDERVKLVCSAAQAPAELFPEGDNQDSFRRAASRLMEMQSADYIGLAPQTLTAPVLGRAVSAAV